MGLGTNPASQWTTEQVSQWVASLQLPSHVSVAFMQHQVVGADLPSLTAEDLSAMFGCTPFQAKKLLVERSKLGIGGGDAPPAVAPGAAAVTGYPSMPVAPMASSPPPQAQAYAPPTQAYPPPTTPALSGQLSGLSAGGSASFGGSQPSSAREMELESQAAARQREVAMLRAELDRERLKADMRQEMETKARLSAMEAAQRAPAAAPVVVSNNNNLSNSTAATSAATAAAAAAAAASRAASEARRAGSAAASKRLVRKEKYCGCCSFFLFFIFPCICCCPVDERDVVYEPAYVNFKSGKALKA